MGYRAAQFLISAEPEPQNLVTWPCLDMATTALTTDRWSGQNLKRFARVSASGATATSQSTLRFLKSWPLKTADISNRHVDDRERILHIVRGDESLPRCVRAPAHEIDKVKCISTTTLQLASRPFCHPPSFGTFLSTTCRARISTHQNWPLITGCRRATGWNWGARWPRFANQLFLVGRRLDAVWIPNIQGSLTISPSRPRATAATRCIRARMW